MTSQHQSPDGPNTNTPDDPHESFRAFMMLSGWLSLLCAAGMCLLAISAFVAPTNWFTDNMSFFHRQFLAGAGLALIGSLLTAAAARRFSPLFRRAQLVVLVMIVTTFSLLLARTQEVTTSDTAVSEEAVLSGPSLRIVTINIEGLALSDERFVGILRDLKPDILLLEETYWDHQIRYDRNLAQNGVAALDPVYPRNMFVGQLGDLVVFSRFPALKDSNPIVVGIPPTGDHPDYFANRELINLTLDVDGTAFHLTTVHPESPRTKDRWDNRKFYYEKLDQTLTEQSLQDDLPTVVMGDWNTSPWSGAFLTFLKDHKLRTAFPDGIPQTTRFFFDYRLHWILGAIVDHIAVSDTVRIDNIELGPDVGSDHLPVIADITIGENIE